MSAAAPDPQGGRTGALLDAIATQRRWLDEGRAAVQQGAGDRHRRSQIAGDVTRAERDLDAAVVAALSAPDGPSDDAILDAAEITPERLAELRAGGA